MIEALIVDWLNLDPGPWGEASMDVPADRPDRFVTVERVGGPEGYVTGSPLLAVQVWAKYRFEAADHAEQLMRRLRSAVSLPWIARVTVSSIHNFPDGSGQARYQISVEMVTKFD